MISIIKRTLIESTYYPTNRYTIQKISKADIILRKSQIITKGYKEHEPKNSNFSVRLIKPITYRVLHLIIHSNYYMLLSLGIYKDSDLKKLFNLNQYTNLENYLRKHLENDYSTMAQ